MGIERRSIRKVAKSAVEKLPGFKPQVEQPLVSKESQKQPEITSYERQTAALREVISAAVNDPEGRASASVLSSLIGIATFREYRFHGLQEQALGRPKYTSDGLRDARQAMVDGLIQQGISPDDVDRDDTVKKIDAKLQQLTTDALDTAKALATVSYDTPPKIDKEAEADRTIAQEREQGTIALLQHAGNLLADSEVPVRVSNIEAKPFIDLYAERREEALERGDVVTDGPRSLGVRGKVLRDAWGAVKAVEDLKMFETDEMLAFLEKQMQLRWQDLADGKMPPKRAKGETKFGIKVGETIDVKPRETIQPDGLIQAVYEVLSADGKGVNYVVVQRSATQGVEVFHKKGSDDYIIVRPLNGDLEEVRVSTTQDHNLYVQIRPGDIKRLEVASKKQKESKTSNVTVGIEDGDIDEVLIDGSGGEAKLVVYKGTIGKLHVNHQARIEVNDGDVMQADLGDYGVSLDHAHGDAGKVTVDQASSYHSLDGDTYEIALAGEHAKGTLVEGNVVHLIGEGQFCNGSVGGSVGEVQLADRSYGQVEIGKNVGKIESSGRNVKVFGSAGEVIAAKGIVSVKEGIDTIIANGTSQVISYGEVKNAAVVTEGAYVMLPADETGEQLKMIEREERQRRLQEEKERAERVRLDAEFERMRAIQRKRDQDDLDALVKAAREEKPNHEIRIIKPDGTHSPMCQCADCHGQSLLEYGKQWQESQDLFYRRALEKHARKEPLSAPEEELIYSKHPAEIMAAREAFGIKTEDKQSKRKQPRSKK